MTPNLSPMVCEMGPFREKLCAENGGKCSRKTFVSRPAENLRQALSASPIIGTILHYIT